MKNTLTPSRLWIVSGVVVALLVFMLGFFLVINPQAAKAQDAQDRRDSLEAMNQQLMLTLNKRRSQNAELPTKQAQLAAVKAAMPADVALADVTRSLESLASTAKVDLTSISPSAPAPVVVSTPGQPTAAAQAATDPAQQGTTAAGAQVFEVPVTLDFAGSFDNSRAFVRALQHDLPRAFLIETLSVQAAGKSPQDNGTVKCQATGKLFVYRDPAEVKE